MHPTCPMPVFCGMGPGGEGEESPTWPKLPVCHSLPWGHSLWQALSSTLSHSHMDWASFKSKCHSSSGLPPCSSLMAPSDLWAFPKTKPTSREIGLIILKNYRSPNHWYYSRVLALLLKTHLPCRTVTLCTLGQSEWQRPVRSDQLNNELLQQRFDQRGQLNPSQLPTCSSCYLLLPCIPVQGCPSQMDRKRHAWPQKKREPSALLPPALSRSPVCSTPWI